MSSLETKKAQLALRKFEEVAELHLDILKTRRRNIRKYRSERNYRALSVEKKRADLVVKQLYDDVQQMFTWCSDLPGETWEWVQCKLRPLNVRIQSELAEFVNECDCVADDDVQTGRQKHQSCPSTVSASSAVMDIDDLQSSTDQRLAYLSDSLQQRQQDAEGHRQLLSDILELNDMMKQMDAVVRVQGETVETIEGNVDRAVSNVHAGERHLFKAMKSKAAQYPLAGALIGAGAAAGPVGMLIGLKVALVAAIGGSAIGAISGRILQNKVADGANAAGSHEMTPMASGSRRASEGKTE